MPNAIKYNVSAQTLALKDGNFWIGTGDVSKATTAVTDYWNGITPPTDGYTIYLNKASQGPSIYVAANDSELISLTNKIGSQSFTTVAQCLSWYFTQNDKMVLNIDYPSIITNGLVLNLDPGFASSYPRTGATLYDLSSISNNASLVNGPGYSNSSGRGSITMDGTNDYVSIPYNANFATNTFTLDFWFYLSNSESFSGYLVNYGVGSGLGQWYIRSSVNLTGINFSVSGTGTPNACTSDIAYTSFPGGLRVLDWYNFTMTYTSTGDQAKLYINGLFFQNIQVVSSVNRASWNTEAVTFGGPNTTSSFSVSAFKFYNRVLSSTEILNNYQSTLPRFLDQIITSGLVLYLDAGYIPSYPTTGTSWKDLSGNSNNATLVNGPTFNGASISLSGKTLGSIVFDGVNDYCSTTLSKTFSSITIQVWFYRSGNQTSQFSGLVANRSPENTDVSGLLLNINGNQSLGYNWNNSPDAYNWNSGLVLDYLGWHFLSLSVSPSSATGFLNGVFATNNIEHSAINLSNLAIGKDYLTERHITGRIAAVYIYDRALSNTEVQQNYNATKGTFIGSRAVRFVTYNGCGASSLNVYVVDGSGLTIGNTVYTDVGLTTPYSNQIFATSIWPDDPTSYNDGIQTNRSGVITSISTNYGLCPVFC